MVPSTSKTELDRLPDTLHEVIERCGLSVTSAQSGHRCHVEPVLWPGVCLTVVVYSLNMFGDAVRDLLDPRLRGRLGRYGAGRDGTLRRLRKA